jgi:hypothetical protein
MTKKITVSCLWVGPRLSQLEQKSIQSFLNLGYNFDLYVYDPVDNVPKKTRVKDANTIVPRQKLFTLMDSFLPFSDYWRYQFLYQKGGIWVDLDMIAVRPFPFNEYEYVFSSEATVQSGTYKMKEKAVTNIGVLKAPKKSQFYKELLENCDKKLARGPLKKKTELMKDLREQVKRYGFEKYVMPPMAFCPVHWWHTKEMFYPKPGQKPMFPRKWAVAGYSKQNITENPHVCMIHFWRSIAKNRHHIEFDADDFPEDSLFKHH